MKAKSKVLRLTTIFSVIALAGCVNSFQLLQLPPEKTYVSSISENETVMVIPFNNYIQQIQIARGIEMVLVNLGFNVRSYEMDIKEVERRTGSGISGTRLQDRAKEVDSIGAESNEITIERFSYERINADYILEVMFAQRAGVVKIVKTKEKAVVAVCGFDDYSLEDDIEACLSEKHMIVEKTP